MTLDFTKIRWANGNYTLITERGQFNTPILILDDFEIKRLNDEWTKKENTGVSETKVRFNILPKKKKENTNMEDK